MENKSINNTMYPFIFVHGAWSAPFVWDQVKTKISGAGSEVLALQLPGHGTDHSDPANLHLDSYIDYVAGAIKTINEKVILVGHSFAGMIISGVAEQVPELVEKLVYVAAYVPQNGDSAYGISQNDQDSLLGNALIPSADGIAYDVKKEEMINVFCQDASKEMVNLLFDHYRAEPAAPFSEPVSLSSERFGSVKKFYISTLLDHGIGHNLQKRMIVRAGISDVYELNTGHTPALTAPEKLSSILLDIMNKG